MTAGDMLKGASFVFSINRSFQLEGLTWNYIAGTEVKGDFPPEADPPEVEMATDTCKYSIPKLTPIFL